MKQMEACAVLERVVRRGMYWCLCGLAAGLTSAAHAQSGVTLYGIVNPGILAVSNVSGSRAVQEVSGAMQPSRFGFRGSEDLGGGLKTVFQLESGFNINNGKLGGDGGIFNRLAYVGLSDDHWGTVTLGRQFDFMYDDFVISANGVITFNGAFFKMGDSDGIAGQSKYNTIKYVSPSAGGLTVGAMHGFGGVAGSLSRSSTDSLSIAYKQTNFRVAAAYTSLRNYQPVLSNGFNIFGVPVTQTSFDRVNIYGIGGTVTVFGIDFHAVGSIVDYRKAGQSSKLKMIETGASIPLATNTFVGIGYDYYYNEGKHFNQIGMGIDYLLSKRTDVSLSYGILIGSSGTLVQFYGAPGASSTSNQQVVHIGLRHRF